MTMSKGYSNTTAPGTVKGYDGPSTPPATISLSAKQLPAIKSWKVGQTYPLLITAKLVSQSNDSYEPDMTARFEIQDVQEGDDADDGTGEEND